MPSLEIFRRLRDRYREARVLWHLGNHEMQLGRWQAAQSHFREAIGLYEALGVEATLANLYWCQGLLAHVLGDEQASEAAYHQGLVIAQSPEHGDPKAAMDLTLYLGLLYQTQGRWDAAMASYEQAAALAQTLNDQHVLTMILYRRGNVLEHQGHVDAALAAYRDAIACIEELRGATEAEEIKIGLLGTTAQGTTAQVYEAMVRLCLAYDRPEEAFDYVERARSRAFLDTLTAKAPELYETLDQPVATLAEVQAGLPPGALLIEYFTTGVVPRGDNLINRLPKENARLRQHLALPPEVVVFAITRDDFEVHRPALDPNTLRPLPYDPGPGRRMLWNGQLLRLLHERLIAPVQHLLNGRETLFLVPHGPLHYVPFMGLCSPADEYLLDRGGPAIALAPSATILLRNCLGRTPGRAEGLLALGYNGDGDDTLHFAETEARAVARLMEGEAWTGPQPKSSRLLERGRDARWLHFAGHAIYNPRDPLDSARTTC